VSALVEGHDDIVGLDVGGRTFSIVIVGGRSVALFVTAVTIFSVTITVNGAAGAPTILVITIAVSITSVSVTSIILARRGIVSATGRRRSIAAASRGAITAFATTVSAAVPTTISATLTCTSITAGVESPGGRGRSTSPLRRSQNGRIGSCRSLDLLRSSRRRLYRYACYASHGRHHRHLDGSRIRRRRSWDKQSAEGTRSSSEDTHSLLEAVRGAGMSHRTRRP
jgi:hypothetical protein